MDYPGFLLQKAGLTIFKGIYLEIIVIITNFVIVTIKLKTKMNQIHLADKEIVHLGYIANNRTHPTAEEIYGQMTEDFPNVSKTTVYNSLHALTEAGLLRELEIEKSSARYDMAQQKPHAHFTCKACGRIYDMPLPDKLDSLVKEGFVAETAELSFKGICPDCMNSDITSTDRNNPK